MKPLQAIETSAQADAHRDQLAQHFPPLCGITDVARATGYSLSTVCRLQRRGRLDRLLHPSAVGPRRYSGAKLAAIARGEEIPNGRRFFASAKRSA